MKHFNASWAGEDQTESITVKAKNLNEAKSKVTLHLKVYEDECGGNGEDISPMFVDNIDAIRTHGSSEEPAVYMEETVGPKPKQKSFVVISGTEDGAYVEQLKAASLKALKAKLKRDNGDKEDHYLSAKDAAAEQSAGNCLSMVSIIIEGKIVS